MRGLSSIVGVGRRLPLSVLVPLLILVGSVILGATARLRPAATSSDVRIVAIDVGQGDAILIDGPGDAEILVDGGPTPNLARQLSSLLGADHTIDLIVLTHPHSDHLVGLVEVIERYAVGRILITGVTHTTQEYKQFLEIIRDRKVLTSIAVAGQTYNIGPARLEILYPFEDFFGRRVESLNSSSIVAMLTVAKITNDEISPSHEALPPGWSLRAGSRAGGRMTSLRQAQGLPIIPPERAHSAGSGQAPRVEGSTFDIQASSFRILLTGDAEADVEQTMLERYCGAVEEPEKTPGVFSGSCEALRADVLKVGHHGAQEASSSAFLAAVQPLQAIISVGRRNDYGHPHRRTLKRLERIGARIWRTDQNGDITMTFGSDDLSVSGER